MLKHSLLAFAFALTTSAAMATTPVAPAGLQASLQRLADQASPGQFGLIVVDLSTGATAKVNDDRAYPMMSVFKAPVAAAVLDQVDKGQLSLNRKVHLDPAQRVGGSAVPSIGSRLEKGPLDVTVSELLRAAVSESDNTAVDALLRVAGGGDAATRYLRAKGIEGMRIDVGEGEFGRLFRDLKPGQSAPAHETDAQEDERYRRGYASALASPLNTTTLQGATTFLAKLQAGQLLSPASTKRLLDMMEAQVIPNRIRAGLPTGFTFADKTGTGASNGDRVFAWNDIGIVTAPNGKRVAVAAFLRDSTATKEQRDAWFAELGRLIAAQLK